MKNDPVWLKNAQIVPSPNFDTRPNNTEINLLVIHCISLPPGEYGGPHINDFFQNKLTPEKHPYFAEIFEMQVSAHLLIRRDGHIIQFVDLNKRAWHAGVSSFQGREKCNDYSIGIELEGTDQDSYTNEQYDALNHTIEQIRSIYPAITQDRITGHSDIAPQRKTDPGVGFIWEKIDIKN